MKTITYEQWEETYLPQQNPFTENGSYDNMMFETYDPELTFVKNAGNKHIWTLIDGENENSWIIPGYHFVNRLGYFICENEWEDEELEVDDNEHISVENAVKEAIKFASSIGYTLDETSITNWYADEFEKKETITTGDAKYHLIDFFNEILEIELTEEQENLLHNFYNEI